MAIIFSIIFKIFVIYPIDRDIIAPFDKAQTFAECEDILNYVNIAISGLEQRDYIKGNCAVFFPKSDNDMEIQYKSLINIRKRLIRTCSFDKNSQEYQSAIDDLRGTIRETEIIYCPILKWWRDL